ncbi:kunitz-type serine protease inhibitor PPTI-like [Harmonia axyridis]|uniref:kunitz-type serine protease inhibitor PPTI-like n=1 Tax=Harmonia axyridis TaxID=115357 RepID=UPI001E275D5D|nr:kunitz-type serine protease inhibitor PPTI-like [Harmonia axyridis]
MLFVIEANCSLPLQPELLKVNMKLIILFFVMVIGYSRAAFTLKDCEPPTLPGRCKAHMRIFYWNGSACTKGMYGGCGSRQKIFLTKIDCLRIAKPICSTETKGGNMFDKLKKKLQ